MFRYIIKIYFVTFSLNIDISKLLQSNFGTVISCFLPNNIQISHLNLNLKKINKCIIKIINWFNL